MDSGRGYYFYCQKQRRETLIFSRHRILNLFFLIIISSCSLSVANVSPEGDLEIFGPSHGFTGDNVPNDWVLEGSDKNKVSTKTLIINDTGSTPILRLNSSNKNFVLLRRTSANLLASPYLGWSWRIHNPSGQNLPISIVIGFYGGDPTSRSWGSKPLVYLGTKVPPYDRIIAIVWGKHSDTKGIIKIKNKMPHYIAGSGINKKNVWLIENIDLSKLYRQIWPKDDVVRTRIMFVGFTSASSDVSATADFGDMVLYR